MSAQPFPMPVPIPAWLRAALADRGTVRGLGVRGDEVHLELEDANGRLWPLLLADAAAPGHWPLAVINHCLNLNAVMLPANTRSPPMPLLSKVIS